MDVNDNIAPVLLGDVPALAACYITHVCAAMCTDMRADMCVLDMCAHVRWVCAMHLWKALFRDTENAYRHINARTHCLRTCPYTCWGNPHTHIKFKLMQFVSHQDL